MGSLLKRVDYDIENSDDDEHVKNLNEFLEFVAASEKAKRLSVEVMEALDDKNKSNDILLDVEKIFEEVEEDFNKSGKKCTVDDLRKLLDPNEDFDGYPEKVESSGIGEFFVSSYYKLNNNIPSFGQKDHIPSYKAIETFLIIKGINVPLKTEKDNKDINISKSRIDEIKNKLKKTVGTLRNKLLEENTTTIAVDTTLHGKTRTYAGRNKYDQYIDDAYDLKMATKLDIAFTLYDLRKNNLYQKYNKHVS